MKKLLFPLLAAVALQCHAVSASAAVMDFESLAHADDQIADVGYSYSEDGFLLSNLMSEGFPFATYGTLNEFFSGSTALINDNDAGLSQLTRQDGGAFNLQSIDLAELYGYASSVSFIGTKVNGVTVSASFDLDGQAGAETFTFGTDFTNLSSVTWANNADYHQFDNISVSAVPEPASIAMLMAGLGLLGAIGRRRSSK